MDIIFTKEESEHWFNNWEDMLKRSEIKTIKTNVYGQIVMTLGDKEEVKAIADKQKRRPGPTMKRVQL
jgi:hypothetical protein